MAAPVKVFKCQNVSAAIFKSDAGMYTVKVSTSYKKAGSTEWSYSDSLGAKDALVGAHLLRKAADWIMENDAERPSYRRTPVADAPAPRARPAVRDTVAAEHQDMFRDDGVGGEDPF